MTTAAFYARIKLILQENSSITNLADADLDDYIDEAMSEFIMLAYNVVGPSAFSTISSTTTTLDADGVSSTISTVPLLIVDVAVDFNGDYKTCTQVEGGYEEYDKNVAQSDVWNPTYRFYNSKFYVSPKQSGTLKYSYIAEQDAFSTSATMPPLVPLAQAALAWYVAYVYMLLRKEKEAPYFKKMAIEKLQLVKRGFNA